MRELRILRQITRLENAEGLDPIVKKVKGIVEKVIRPQAVRDILHGVPFGHPIHPISVQVPIGAWLSAAVLDLLPKTSRASGVLVGVGIAGVLPSVATGWTDWSKLHPGQMRVGLVHAAANYVSVSLYSLSLIQRIRGRRTSGVVLSYLGLAVVSGAGFLGGHLAYRQAAGANHTEHVPSLFPSGWQSLGGLDELPEGELIAKTIAGQSLLVLRRGVGADVLSNTCSHLSAPLDEGELSGSADDPCVRCPWHDSVFSIRTGEVVHGPATAPQPRFETRVIAGVLEVRLPSAG